MPHGTMLEGRSAGALTVHSMKKHGHQARMAGRAVRSLPLTLLAGSASAAGRVSK